MLVAVQNLGIPRIATTVQHIQSQGTRHMALMEQLITIPEIQLMAQTGIHTPVLATQLTALTEQLILALEIQPMVPTVQLVHVLVIQLTAINSICLAQFN